MHHYLIRIKGFHKHKNKFYRVYKFGKSKKDFEEQRKKGYHGCNKCEKILKKIQLNEDFENYFLDKLRDQDYIHFVKELGNEYFIINASFWDQENDVIDIDNYLKCHIDFSLFNIDTTYKVC